MGIKSCVGIFVGYLNIKVIFFDISSVWKFLEFRSDYEENGGFV